VKMAALRALAAVPDASSIKDLELAANDRLKDIREFALVTMLDQDPEGRFEAFVRALDWIDVTLFRGFVKRHGDKTRRHVEAALNHQRDDLRSAAFTALGDLSATTRLELLGGLVTKSQRREQRLAALEAIVRQQGARAVELLVSLSEGGDELVRVRSIAHLGRLGHKGAEANLLGWLDDPSERIRVAAANAVLRL
jgi:HEAT repeat protein